MPKITYEIGDILHTDEKYIGVVVGENEAIIIHPPLSRSGIHSVFRRGIKPSDLPFRMDDKSRIEYTTKIAINSILTTLEMPVLFKDHLPAID
jgi:hypothetical protein